MKISVFLFFVSFLSTIKGYSQEKTITIKNTIGFGKEIYQVKDKKSKIKQGPYLYNYSNKVQIKGQFVNNFMQGNWQYSIGGNLTINAFYNNGGKDSLWTYSEDNKIISEVHYRNDKRHGIAIGYYKQGKILSTIPYQNGKIDGIRKSFYENGNIKLEVKYKNDTLDGALKYYDIKGKVILHILYKNDKPFSLEIMEMPDSIRYFSGNLKNGTGSISMFFKKIDSDSIFLLSKQEYLNGLLDGKCTEYDDYRGNLKFTGYYKRNIMIGQWNYYNPSNPKTHALREYSLKDSIRKDATDLYPVVLTKIPRIFKQDMPKFYTKDGFRAYVASCLKYPETAAELGIMGRLYTQFDVDVTGAIYNVKVVNKANEDLSKEALRIVETSPNWIPGFEDNIPCNVRYTFPITFILR